MGISLTSPLVENNSLSIGNDLGLEGFRQYLSKDRRKTTVKQSISYAVRYGYVLQTKDARQLLELSPKNRQHAMRALACLAKYRGVYDEWKHIKEKYGLKWTVENDLQVFHNITDGSKNYKTMLQWLKDTCHAIPSSYAKLLIYCTLTGLRPSEACTSVRLIRQDLATYLNMETTILEHFKYPDLFIRRTKRAYISLVDEKILNIAGEATNCGYNAFRLYLKRNKLDMNMNYCRKIFGTYLRLEGIESETIDLLQGRIPKTVFARHYFRPDGDYGRVRNAIDSLYDTIVD